MYFQDAGLGRAPQAAGAATGEQGLSAAAPARATACSLGELDPSLLRGELLHEIFEETADRHPDRAAVECRGVTWTYRQLDERANRVARTLHARGIRPGDCVAMLLPRSADTYVALLGILKAGAAYVPLDPDYPAERVQYIVSDCHARAVLTCAELEPKIGQAAPVLRIETLGEADSRRLTRDDTGAALADVCYVIYTSGTTGRPKGVQIEHRSACNLVRAEARLFAVTPADRVYQGFSIAFDASVEEVWLAFAAGATLVVGTKELTQAGPELARRLADLRVTVWSTVPTLLSMLDGDPEPVRLLILGGESCPADLVTRFARPGRRMVNTYGPTEATVIATFADLDPARPVTIGRPIPNYRCYILDENLRPVRPGESGELHIGGVGLARGYVGRPDLTAERFLPDPFAASSGSSAAAAAPRLYKTGDLARFNSAGEIEFLGRADTQVKIRGFRVELAEIEAALLSCAGVKAAVVSVREDTPGLQVIVGYFVRRDAAPAPRQEDMRAVLRERLPAYMVPSVLEELPELPTLPSGKVDRKHLPAPKARAAEQLKEAPRTDTEHRVAAVWEDVFRPNRVGISEHFFTDLGGHSLAAATVVSRLRREEGFGDVSVADIYAHPTVRALSAELDQRARHGAERAAVAARTTATTPGQADAARRHRWCSLAQLAGLYLVLAYASVQWLGPYLTYAAIRQHVGHRSVGGLIVAALVPLALQPLLLAFSILAKWLLIGRYREGAWPLWGAFYFRWWLLNRVLAVTPVGMLAGTPLLNWYYRLMGARIGKDVYLGTGFVAAYDLLAIGQGASINSEASLLGYTIEDGLLRIGKVEIGRRCVVGARSVIGIGTRMDDFAELAELSLLPAGSRIGKGQKWSGSPARLVGKLEQAEEVLTTTRARRAVVAILHALVSMLIPAAYLVAMIPGVYLAVRVNRAYAGWWFLLTSPAAGASFVLLLCAEIVALKWLLLGRVKAGRYPLHSWFFVRKRAVDQLMDVSLHVIGQVYATLYLVPFFKALGARLGRRVELSTAHSITPDLCHLGDESFIADSVCLGAPRVRNGILELGQITIGPRTFIGNSALVPTGSSIPGKCLIGVMSRPPEMGLKEGTSWLGSPAIYLPRRQAAQVNNEAATYRPTKKLYAQRLVIEFFRVTLPATFAVALGGVLMKLAARFDVHHSALAVSALFPLLFTACGLAAAAVVIAAKWLLMGRYRPGQHPLWSTFVWRTELVTALHEHLADPFLVALLDGTPFICLFFRALGSRVGKRVYMETTALTEFDLIRIGDDVSLNLHATVQSHLFEDRVMKMSYIDIQDGCSVGAWSSVLYDTQLAASSGLGDLSLLMKGESLPASTRWHGTPARRKNVAPVEVQHVVAHAPKPLQQVTS